MSAWKFREPLPGRRVQEGYVELFLPYGDLPVLMQIALLEEIEIPIPEEPPIGSVVLNGADQAWQRLGVRWYCTNRNADSSTWEHLQNEGPLVSLIRKPALEDR